MIVRRFQSEDIDAVFEIKQAAYGPLYEKYHDDLTNPFLNSKGVTMEKFLLGNTRGYVFVEDDEIVGYVRVKLYPEGTHKISTLSVHPKHQNKGIAQQALAEIERIHSDATRWFLDTILEEAGNCHLYEKMGYKRTGKTAKINDKMTLVFYEKNNTRKE